MLVTREQQQKKLNKHKGGGKLHRRLEILKRKGNASKGPLEVDDSGVISRTISDVEADKMRQLAQARKKLDTIMWCIALAMSTSG